ncbi:MAG: VWA domain-containing protein [Candidatus Hodarchaeales archaeon]|jgi:hypothetical protein
MSKKLICIVTILLFSFALLPSRNITIVQGASYQRNYTTTNSKFNFYYNDTDGGARQLVTLAQVQDFGNNVLEPVRAKELSYGFPDTSGYPKRVDIFEQRQNAHGGSGGMNFDPWWLGNTFYGPVSATETRLVAIHEFQHVLQYSQGLSHLGGAWVTEGQARMLQDKLYNDLDLELGTDMASYLGQVNSVLGDPDHPLMDRSYGGSLFWAYVCEKYGTIATEPDLGLDAIVQWWEAARYYGTASDQIRVFNKMLDNLGHGSTTFEDVFKDFIVSLYAKDLTGAGVPGKYKYADETQTPYQKVGLNVNDSLPYGSTIAGTEFVDLWTPKYYAIWPENREPGTLINVEVRQLTSNDLFYDLLVIKDNDIVSETRITGTHFSRSVVTDADVLVLVVGGLANSDTDPAKFHYSFSSGTGFYVDIQSPQNVNGQRARVGNSTDPEKFLSIVEVLSSGNPVHGLTYSDFNAEIGTNNANIVSATYLWGLYFLEIQAPNQPSNGYYDLRIELAGTSDTETNSVDYSDTFIDSMLVIDRSGSMGWTEKIDAAQAAGRLFVNSFLRNDYLGLTTFSDVASRDYGLDEVDSIRSTIIDAINDISTGGATSVGDGILTAQNELFSNGHATYNKHVILLTDGVENTAPFINDVDQFLWDGANNTYLHVVLIGLDAEARKLQNVALTSGGGVYFAFDPSSGTLTSDLADIYRSIIEDVTNEQRVYSKLGSRTGSWTLSETFNMDLAKSGTVIINYNSTIPLSSDDFELANTSDIIKPSYFSQKMSSYGNYYGHAIFHLEGIITAGSYEIRTNSANSGTIEYFVEAAVVSPISADMFFGLPESQRIVANEMPVLVSVSDNRGPIEGASVFAEVMSGTGYKSYKTWRIQLYDDGGHGDGFANDGVYGNNFTRTYFDWRTEDNRTYVVKAKIEGNSNAGGTFIREANGAFTLIGDRLDQKIFVQDSDNDGMPDHWEIRHGLNPTSDIGDDGPSGDPDYDSLLNRDELEEGTYPNDPDSDNGGEKDSELMIDHDPCWPDDDLNPPVVHASPGNGQVTLVISGNPSYSSFNLYRSNVSPSTGFTLIKLITADGSSDIKIEDDGLTNGVQVWYAAVALGTSGEETTPSKIVSATPRSDFTPPTGFIVINSGNNVTTSTTVHLRLLASLDVVEMKLSNHSDFRGASWQPHVNETSVVLDGTGLQYVYVQYKDSAGNIGASDVGSAWYFYDGIIVNTTAPLPIPTTTTTTSTTLNTTTPTTPNTTTPASLNATTPTSSTPAFTSSWSLTFSLSALLTIILVFKRRRKSRNN